VEAVVARTVTAAAARRAASELGDEPGRPGASAVDPDDKERASDRGPFQPTFDPLEARFRELEGK